VLKGCKLEGIRAKMLKLSLGGGVNVFSRNFK
jgi:hypothetical protein